MLNVGGKRTRMTALASLLALSGVFVYLPAQAAGLTGDTLDSVFFATGDYAGPQSFTVPQSVSPYPGIATTDGAFGISVSDDSVVFTSTGLTPFSSGYTFNGIQFSIVSGPDTISNVTVDPSSTLVGFSASDISFTRTTLDVNFAGLTFTPFNSLTLDVRSSVVPEPATWAMMLLGFAGLGFVGFRRRRDVLSAA